jgi:hypothetical protein
MTQPYARPVSQADRVISILVIALIPFVGAAAAFLGIFMLAFLDNCPSETCSAEHAALSVWTSIGVGVCVAIAGIVVTIVRLVRQRLAWPFAVGTLLLCGVIGVAGVVGFLISVGA